MPRKLVELCLEVVVKNISLVPTLEHLPDELLQKMLGLCRSKKVCSPHALRLFSATKMSKLDLHHQEGVDVTDEWLDAATQSPSIQQHLQSVDIADAKAVTDEGLMSALARLKCLTSLNVSGCALFTGAGFAALRGVPLQRLVVAGCPALATEAFLNELAHFKTLTALDISNCNLTDSTIQPLRIITSLTSLDISNNPSLTGDALLSVCTLTQLKELLMSHCAKVPAGLNHLSGLSSLTTLSLSHCGVEDDSISHIETLTRLESLSLISAKISDIGVKSIGKLTNLTALDLSMCVNISDRGVKTLHHLVSIKNLNLNYCTRLTDAGVASLTGGLGYLTSLGVIGCNRLLIQANHRRPLVLLAEDDPMQAKIITRVLSRHEFDVEHAHNGQIALDMYRANPSYELIVMDIMMPLMDGLTATMRIRQHEREFGLKKTPIIMQTADAGRTHQQTCLDAGCDDFMTKPLDISLIDKASRLINDTTTKSTNKTDSNNNNNNNNNDNNNNTTSIASPPGLTAIPAAGLPLDSLPVPATATAVLSSTEPPTAPRATSL